jgi:cobalt-zinc-cadmium efflux system membrane fusion protein
MKPLEKILLILKTIVPVILLLLGISCSNPNNQNNTSEQNQSVEEHVHAEDGDHDDHDHDAHDEAEHGNDHADEHVHSEDEVHDDHDHAAHDEAEHNDEHGDEHVHSEDEVHGVHDHEAHDEHAHNDHGHDDSIVKLSKEDMKRFGIEVEKVKAGDIEQHIRVPGEIVINSDSLAHIVPRVTGIAQQVKKNLGDVVKKGEVMAVIESRELADIKAAYLTSIESYELAEPYFKREERLWKKKISSEQDYLDAKKAFAEAKIEMNKAKYKLSALGFSMEYIKNLPSESPHLFTSYEITAPFNGTIIDKHIALGEVVKEDDDIFVVANLDTVWVDLRVPQKDSTSVKKGQKVTIAGKAGTTKAEGTIDYVHSLIDEQTRTKLARVVLDNTSGQFFPGTFVTATVQVGNSETDVVVDKKVLQDIDDETCVFVQTDHGFEPRHVMIGRSNDTCVEIIDGLESGEIIVTENSFRIKAQLEKAAAGEHAGHGHSH